ncbi:hypothetical protein NQ314_005730 [Rhamnusium bicolor]|uniref:Uncharacterized protein n=1 Tax=Rhamnusium bicolor TaxID=1586634 RepID=A0AAV8ZDB2_9CUCU|nr:hypothetical protein NQ314_005730 [Rhamnusium bicolor]
MFQEKNRHLPCFAHTLDLTASDNENMKPLIEKVKKTITYFKQSVNAADELRRVQPEDKTLKLKQSLPTRWNSVFYMLERFLMLNKYVASIILSDSKAPEIMTASELEEIKEFIQILKPIESVSKELSGEKYIYHIK